MNPTPGSSLRTQRRWSFKDILPIVVGFSETRVKLGTAVSTPIAHLGDLRRLAADIARRESHWPDIVPGAEMRVTFQNPGRPAKTRYAVVYIHGFTACRQETAPLAERLSNRLAANRFETRITGHGRRDPAALGEASADAWLNDTAEAIAIGLLLGEEVIVIGSSTGGSAIAWMLCQEGGTDSVAAVFLLSPAFDFVNWKSRILLWPWGVQLAELTSGKMIEWENPPISEEVGKFWTWRFPTAAVGQVACLSELARNARLDNLRTPAVIFYSKADQIVDPKATEVAFRRIQRGGDDLIHRLIEMTTADASNHTLAGRLLSPETTDEVIQHMIPFLADIGIFGPEDSPSLTDCSRN